MLSADPWQNPANALDVLGGSGKPTPLDALAIINDLNQNGTHALTPLASDYSSSSSVSPQATSSTTPLYLDVNGDGMVSPLDALKVIDALNGNGDQIQVTLVAADMNGVPLSSVAVGTKFELEAFVSDVSGNATPYVGTPVAQGGTAVAQGGVFETELDATYNSSLASISTSASVTFGTDYPNGHRSNLSTAGQIVGTGAFGGTDALGPGQILLWSIPVTAKAAGVETFTPSAGSTDEFAVYGNDNPIPSSQVDFVPATINIVAANSPLLSISSATISRPTSGTQNETFTVTLANGSTTQSTTVAYTTQDGQPVAGPNYSNGNAVAGTDYQTASGTLTFLPGQTTLTITVPIIGSTAYNPSSTYTVNLSNPVNASIAEEQGTGTITSSNPAPVFTISNPTPVSRPTSGTVDDVFTVTLSGPTELYSAVNYYTSDDTAFAGTDYTSTTGQLVLQPGTNTAQITVPILGNTTTTGSVDFTLNLQTPTNATVGGTGFATGTIVSPTFSIATPASITRPSTGTQPYVFTVTLANPSTTQATTVNFATSDGTAAAGKDYQQTNGTLTFPANTTTEQITVPIIGSTAYNPSSSFTVTLSSPSTGAELGTAVATGTIISSNPAPTLAIATPSSLTRPSSGTSNYVFTVTLTGATELPATVNYATADGTAHAGTDYQQTTGVLTFPAGITTEQITVPVIGFSTPAGSVNFTVNLSSPTNSTITTAQATGTIVTPTGPTLSINNAAAVTKPSVGNTADAYFTVTLANPSSTLTTTVNYATADGTAVQGIDYQPTSGTLTFAPGTTSLQITVPVIGSNSYSPTTTFSVNLSSPTNGTISTGTGTGTILSTNPAPTLAISSPSPVTRPSAGNTADAYFTVTLSGATKAQATVAFATADGTAVHNIDYQSTSGTLTFPAGTTSEVITVPIIGSNAYNPSSSFTVNLSSPSNATISTGTGTGTINSSNPAPTLAINSVSINRPANGNTANEVFTVTLSGATELAATVQYATADGTAVHGTDYTSASGTLTFPAGTTTENITVPVIGSAAFNNNLTYTVNLSSPTNSTITTAQGTGTITNVASAPTLSVSSPTIARLTSGNVNEVFTVTLTGATALPATVQYATADNTAVQGVDYTSANGTLTFNPGTTSLNVTVQVLPSTSYTGSQTYFLNLSNPTNAQPASVQGTGTITSAVAAPTFAISDPTVTKPTSGTIDAVFTVTLTGNTTQTSTVHFATQDGTAHAPGDYTANSGTLTFAQGVTSENITVAVNGNSTVNPNETFSVVLSNPTNSTITTASATGTIVSPPVVPAISINSVTHYVGTSPITATNFVFTVSLSSSTTATVTVQFATADGTATVANNNYAATSGTLTFSPGTTSENITVAAYGYSSGSTSLNFYVNLSNPSNGTLSTSQGVGTMNGNYQVSTLSGAEFIDANSNGSLDSGELAIQNATIKLTGTDVLNNSVSITTSTAANGSYSFSNLTPGTYTITAIQSSYLTALSAVVGTEGGTASGTNAINLTIGSSGGVTGTGNNFTESGFSIAAVSERIFLASKNLNGTVNLNDTTLFPAGSGTASSAVVTAAVASPAVASPAVAASTSSASPAVSAAVASPAVASASTSSSKTSSSTSAASVDAAFADPQLTSSELSTDELGFASTTTTSASAVDAVYGRSVWMLAR